MSWSGTVRCSHCYQRGHNRRSCPQITKHHLDQYATYKRLRARSVERAETDGANMYEMHMDAARTAYVKRTGLDPDTGAKVKRKAAKAERMKNVQCGYCSGLGHTRRVCETVKADYQVYLVETRRVRENVLTMVQESGIGPGSMVAFPARGYGPDGTWGTWTKLNYVAMYMWDEVDAHSRGLEVRYVDYKNIHRMHDPYSVERIAFETLQQRMKEVPEDAPAPSLAGSINPPDGWLDGSRNLKEAFPTTGNRHNKERPYEYRWPSDSKQEVIRSLGLEEHYPNVDCS
jgi:hypothetical protein